MTSLHNPVALPTSLFEKREELRRILESKHFASSPKKSRFLEFVSEQAFLGNGDLPAPMFQSSAGAWRGKQTTPK